MLHIVYKYKLTIKLAHIDEKYVDRGHPLLNGFNYKVLSESGVCRKILNIKKQIQANNELIQIIYDGFKDRDDCFYITVKCHPCNLLNIKMIILDDFGKYANYIQVEKKYLSLLIERKKK